MNTLLLSATEIANIGKALNLMSVPISLSGIKMRAESEDWDSTQVKGKGGRGGIKTLYKLPDYVIKEIADKGLLDALNQFQEPDIDRPIHLDIPQRAVPHMDVPQMAPPPTSKAKSTKQLSDSEVDQRYAAWAKGLDINSVVPIQYYRNVRASAGFGALNYDESADVMWFRKEFIKSYLGVNPARCICIRVKGDSMYPTVKPDSTILADTTKQYNGEGIYLIRMGDELKVKRLQKVGTHLIRIISDNKELYPMEEIDLSNIENHEFEVIGRAIWTGVLL